MHDGSKHAKDFQHGRQSKGSRTLKMSDRSNQTGLSVVQMKRDFFYTFHMQSHKDLAVSSWGAAVKCLGPIHRARHGDQTCEM